MWRKGTVSRDGAGQAAPRTAGRSHATPPAAAPQTLADYLREQQNPPEDIAKAVSLGALSRGIVEIGCGGADMARDIALKNADTAVWATDIYDWQGPCRCGSGYRRMAMAWRNRRLAAQRACPENLAVLRAEAHFIAHLPDHSLDGILLVNPEPRVGVAIVTALAAPPLYAKLRPGTGRIVVLPFSREMGMMACGGFEFDHGPDWSRGLAVVKSSPLAFRKGQRHQWGVDLTASGYTRNSTQSDVYIHEVPDHY